ncbi:MAG: hypothetical protein WBA89_04320 [Microcoleus sp.]|uniref:hypothetical protein n=1 Tax=Microcoleus sp. TaxID=44472 RepID=UPI003C750D6D
MTIETAKSPKLDDENLLGLGLVEKLEKEKFDRTAHRKKRAKRSIVRANQPSKELAPTTAAAIPDSRRMAVALSGAPAAPKSPRRTTAQNLQQQPGAEIAMSGKQQPNSIEFQSLITYNLNQMQQAVLPAASN